MNVSGWMKMIDVEGGVDPATAWVVAKGVLKAAALFGGSALVVGTIF